MAVFVEFINAETGETVAVNPEWVQIVERASADRTHLWIVDVKDVFTVEGRPEVVVQRLEEASS